LAVSQKLGYQHLELRRDAWRRGFIMSTQRGNAIVWSTFAVVNTEPMAQYCHLANTVET